MSELTKTESDEIYQQRCYGKRVEKPKSELAPAPGSAHLRMSGENARTIITNCHAMMRNKFRGVQLWSMVGHITGHGSGYSIEICKTANLDPMQPCGAKQLRDCAPNGELTDSSGH